MVPRHILKLLELDKNFNGFISIDKSKIDVMNDDIYDDIFSNYLSLWKDKVKNRKPEEQVD